MASAMQPISVADGDSVIYEHIIPRSVRQKWMKRTSTGNLDLILKSARERMNFKKPEQIVVGSLEADRSDKGLEYGDSIVSRDVHNLNDISNEIIDNRSESRITPEEEQAVFTAFGVKLRHTGSNTSIKPTLDVGARQFEDTEVSKRDLGGSKGKDNNVDAQVKLRNITRKPRPVSMPAMTDKIETNCQMQVDDLTTSKPKPKAYISPHAKVPWKRNITKKAIDLKERDRKVIDQAPGKKYEQESRIKVIGTVPTHNTTLHSNESKNGTGRMNDLPSSEPDRYSKLKSSKQENHFGLSAHLGGKPIDSDIVSGGDVVSALQSVSERKKSFEQFDRLEHARTAKGLVEHSVGKSSHNGGFYNERQFMVIDSDNQSCEKQTVERKNIKVINTNNKENVKTFNGINRKLYDQKAKVSKDASKATTEKFSSSNESHRKLVDVMPVNLPHDKKTEKSTDVIYNTERITAKDKGNENSNELDKNIPLTVGKKYEKKIKKMMIMTGEQRDRELSLKSKISSSADKKVPKEIKNKIPNKSSFTKDTVNKAKANADIPVTNLDDTIPMLTHNHDQGIPITNLDELPAPNCPSTLQATDKKTKVNQNHPGSIPPRKPGKYDADRRELVAPKVIFDSPVTGLVSALSPKGKKNRKKKLRVSFLSDDLEKVHTYPSESAAMEFYDELDGQNDAKALTGNSEKSIDEVMADESNFADFQCYMPSSFSDISGTLERERRAITRQNEISTHEKVSTESAPLSSLEESSTVFTETSVGGTNAILF